MDEKKRCAETIKVTKGKYPTVFGGIGFHNNEAMLYKIIEPEHFNQVLGKCYREIAPGFMRTFGGYDDWTRDHMDSFVEYYEKMQKVTDTPIYLAGAKGKMHFSEEEMEKWANDVADKFYYLKREKGVKHLRYYCFSNEMSQCGWGDLMKNLPLFKRYHEMLYRAFQNKGVDIGLVATDASGYENWKTAEWAMEHMNLITEDYCVHIYEMQHGIEDLDFYDFFYDKCNDIVKKAISHDGRRVILGEVGLQKNDTTHLTYQNGVIADVCRYYENDFERAHCALMQAEMIFAAINAGILSLIYWSYTDYPDPYSCAYAEKEGYAKKWGECEKFVSGTTDVKYNKWGVFHWEDDGDYSAREFYWCLAPLMKLFKSHSKVLDITVEDKLLRCCGVLNRDGSVSIGIVNRHAEPVEIRLDSSLFGKQVRVYEYDPKNPPVNPFADIQEYCALLDREDTVYTLKGTSVTFFTTDYEEKAASVWAEGLSVFNNTLSWEEVSDPKHCYYRVYAAKEPDFIPGRENQIASTIATSLPIRDERLYYKVLSVDTYGNV